MLAAYVALTVTIYDWEEKSCVKARDTNTWALAQHCDFEDKIEGGKTAPRVITVHALACKEESGSSSNKIICSLGTIKNLYNAAIIFNVTLDVSEYEGKSVLFVPFKSAERLDDVHFAGQVNFILSEA